MNYSIIQSAKEELVKYENDCKELKKRVNLSLFSLARTSLNSTEKKRVWQGLSESIKNIAEKAEKMVNKLNGVYFAEEEEVLCEEKKLIVRDYKSLLSELQREKETIVRQVEKDTVLITPLQQKVPKEDYCYFCDIRISSGIPYRLTKEEQGVLEIEIVEGAGFCSQDCLLGHCKEYKNREEALREEEKKSEEKIAGGKKLITQIQLAIADLLSKVNRLENKEKELELDIDILPAEERLGFFRRIARNLGLVKKSSPHTKLAEIKRKKVRLKMELEKKNEELRKTLVILSVDEQVKKERQGFKKKLLHNKRNVHFKKDSENVPEE
jgi:hypothetical protein